jgi:hypothetical protein
VRLSKTFFTSCTKVIIINDYEEEKHVEKKTTKVEAEVE